ncbi:zf-HC2 domain-containing protein [Streptosporangium sp. NPDC023825]|uniref:zf-HC2 domain-containing protein n=1 Tax=Streptosporangium sp. NPDC023825 TaxID=3154909 RepID=UPI0034361594
MSTWHIPGDLLDGYLAGELDPVRAMSVDAHLGGCPVCRAAVPYEREWLEGSWQRLEDRAGRPRPRPAERLLRLVGLPGHVARLVTVTPTPGRAWPVAVLAVLAFGVLAARNTAGALPFFLVTAPVLPLAGIAAAYGPRVDPAHELLAATPLSGPRLLLVRSTAVLTVAFVLAGLASPLLPAPPGLSAAWLLPSLVATSGCLALSTRLPVPVAALITGGLWLAGVAVAAEVGGGWRVPFQPGAQVLYGCAAALLTALVYRRRSRLDPGEPR